MSGLGEPLMQREKAGSEMTDGHSQQYKNAREHKGYRY